MSLSLFFLLLMLAALFLLLAYRAYWSWSTWSSFNKRNLRETRTGSLSPRLKISLELLYHYHCSGCDRWWSIADIKPVPGAKVQCPHCAATHIVPSRILTAKDFKKEGDRDD